MNLPLLCVFNVTATVLCLVEKRHTNAMENKACLKGVSSEVKCLQHRMKGEGVGAMVWLVHQLNLRLAEHKAATKIPELTMGYQ